MNRQTNGMVVGILQDLEGNIYLGFSSSHKTTMTEGTCTVTCRSWLQSCCVGYFTLGRLVSVSPKYNRLKIGFLLVTCGTTIIQYTVIPDQMTQNITSHNV